LFVLLFLILFFHYAGSCHGHPLFFCFLGRKCLSVLFPLGLFFFPLTHHCFMVRVFLFRTRVGAFFPGFAFPAPFSVTFLFSKHWERLFFFLSCVVSSSVGCLGLSWFPPLCSLFLILPISRFPIPPFSLPPLAGYNWRSTDLALPPPPSLSSPLLLILTFTGHTDERDVYDLVPFHFSSS